MKVTITTQVLGESGSKLFMLHSEDPKLNGLVRADSESQALMTFVKAHPEADDFENEFTEIGSID